MVLSHRKTRAKTWQPRTHLHPPNSSRSKLAMRSSKGFDHQLSTKRPDSACKTSKPDYQDATTMTMNKKNQAQPVPTSHPNSNSKPNRKPHPNPDSAPPPASAPTQKATPNAFFASDSDDDDAEEEEVDATSGKRTLYDRFKELNELYEMGYLNKRDHNKQKKKLMKFI